MAALIPGLKVKVEGMYNETRQVLATSIKFKGGDLKDAQKIQAGTHELRVQNVRQQQDFGPAKRGAKSAKGSIGEAAGATHRTATTSRGE
jgi:hypothetical protein